MENLLKEILAKINSMDNKINAMDNKINSMDDKINVMDNKINTLQSDVEHLKVGQEKIKDHLMELDSKNADRHLTITGEIEDLRRSVGSLEIITSKNWNDLARLKHVK
ncbi:hypothetical protein SAMN05446037_101162 [Anaerovirgula multivorans]|uniref:Uncharacterized protein n=1 Tax=Anaerovirgula multivorans TaxID=312168 RepID=A0A239EVZ5_9FIRM|nr:hypothetical protein [Anaerovirgula multivorans]SNS48846.1 hypothetical protein SAMN05446037_101162 [Anaerovirgula multivorans]